MSRVTCLHDWRALESCDSSTETLRRGNFGSGSANRIDPRLKTVAIIVWLSTSATDTDVKSWAIRDFAIPLLERKTDTVVCVPLVEQCLAAVSSTKQVIKNPHDPSCRNSSVIFVSFATFAAAFPAATAGLGLYLSRRRESQSLLDLLFPFREGSASSSGCALHCASLQVPSGPWTGPMTKNSLNQSLPGSPVATNASFDAAGYDMPPTKLA